MWHYVPVVPRTLRPKLELLQQEYVLVQAWKKTVAYIRRHNWFSDTLDLDLKAVDLPGFLGEIANDLRTPTRWKSRPLRLVLAPKSQDWWVNGKRDSPDKAEPLHPWRPRAAEPCQRPEDVTDKLRPLAHVGLRDQVVATALMLCLADRVETRQGDPRPPKGAGESPAPGRWDSAPTPATKTPAIPFMSFGNRLFCDEAGGELRHRWGSTKLYRGFYQDYREFLAQPRQRAEEAAGDGSGRRTFIVRTDIRRFYDALAPEALQNALRSLQEPWDDLAFFELAGRVLCWNWRAEDRSEIERYAKKACLRDLRQVALPQGLVSAGFWANIALFGFDDALQAAHPPDLELVYACRYTDDVRLVVRATRRKHEGKTREETENEIKGAVTSWVQGLLDKHAPGLKLNTADSKTQAVEIESDRPGTILHSQRMNRIQNRVSVGFSASEGLELLESIQGLLMIRGGFTREFDESQWEHTPAPDVPEDTRARFGSYRYRKVFREVRAMLPDTADAESTDAARARPGTSITTRADLDEMTRSFALVLVDKWVADPSNVRILLTALDLWPDVEILESVLDLLRPWWNESDMGLPDAQRVAWYCLSEVFRAGVTETGLFGDPESRPAELSLGEYRQALIAEAWKVINQTEFPLPWYLRQQALLLLFASESFSARTHAACREDDPRHYREMAGVLAAKIRRRPADDFARHAVVLDRCFRKRIPAARWTERRTKALAKLDPSLAAEIVANRDGTLSDGWDQLAKQLFVRPASLDPGSLARLVMEERIARDELTMLTLALLLIDGLKEAAQTGPVPPWRVLLHGTDAKKQRSGADNFPWTEARISKAAWRNDDGLWDPPAFCRTNEHSRYQLGYLLRFALARSADFTRTVNRNGPTPAPSYRSAVSSWAQRKYGGHQAQQAFGGAWLPISDWFERFLAGLLWWPGRTPDEHTTQIDLGIEATKALIDNRKRRLEALAGAATNTQFLPMAFSSSYLRDGLKALRGCVVQTTFPKERDFDDDLTLDSEPARSRHRDHLTNSLALVRQGLRARQHGDQHKSSLDLLVLPELSVHPSDVRRYLVPFAQAFKTIVLAGVTFEELPPEADRLVNTAVWVIPEYDRTNGWNVRIRRQGKRHLTVRERTRRHQGRRLESYRPCQWIVECPSSRELEDVKPLRLTASVCYDATDLGIVADLREHSDVYIVPALNKDVQTFDNLAVALSYQLYQLVVVANNGHYGGSSAYWPIGRPHKRRIMHLHGQNQPTLGFFEIADVVEYRRSRAKELPPRYDWKTPPAGFRKKPPC